MNLIEKNSKIDRMEIPSYKLKHNEQEVTFAIRSMQEINKKAANQKDTPHSHEYYTLLWSQNASGRHIIDYKEYEMNADDIFFVRPGQVHQIEHTTNPEGWVILFSCDFLSKNYVSEQFISNLNLFSDIGSTPPIHIKPQTAHLLKEFFQHIYSIFYSEEDYKFEKIGAYLKLILMECAPYAHKPGNKENPQLLQAGGIIVNEFKRLLEVHFTDWHMVSDYAKSLNISSDYLNNVIKSSIGVTAKELIQRRLSLEAKRLGIHTEFSNKEIAYMIGFNEPSHFSRFFKNIEGLSFSQFRARLNKDLTI
jgi:AraC family transcriptional activator of pobA